MMNPIYATGENQLDPSKFKVYKGNNDERDGRPSYNDERDGRPSFKRSNTEMLDAMGTTMFERANTFTVAFGRTVTDMASTIDPDLAMTNKLIENYNKYDVERKYEGDFPLQTGFIRKKEFWKITVLLGVEALLMAVIALAFMNFNEKIPKEWQTCDYINDSHCGDEGTGKWWWIPLVGSTGFIVGTMRWAVNFPKKLARAI